MVAKMPHMAALASTAFTASLAWLVVMLQSERAVEYGRFSFISSLAKKVAQAVGEVGTVGGKAVITTGVASVKSDKAILDALIEVVESGTMKVDEVIGAVKSSTLPTQSKNSIIDALTAKLAPAAKSDAIRVADAAVDKATQAAVDLARKALEFKAVSSLEGRFRNNAAGFADALKNGSVKADILNSFKTGKMSDADALAAIQKKGLSPGNVAKLRTLAGPNSKLVDDVLEDLKLSPNGAPRSLAERYKWIWDHLDVIAGIGLAAALAALELSLFLEASDTSGEPSGDDQGTLPTGVLVGALVLIPLLCAFFVCCFCLLSSGPM